MLTEHTYVFQKHTHIFFGLRFNETEQHDMQFWHRKLCHVTLTGNITHLVPCLLVFSPRSVQRDLPE